MGRPSVKDERREQILRAYETCVARFGVEGASLEKIAEEAGLARPLIRHNVGNRDDLLAALVDRFLSRSERSVQRMIDALPDSRATETLIDWLFDPNYSDAQFVLVAEALIAASQEDPALATLMKRWTRDFIASLRSVLENEASNASSDDLDAVAAGVAGIYFNTDSLTPMGNMSDVRHASKRAALMLVASLERS
ncbi:MAG: TetR/AcrR family transcriptional regulator [Pseudomonadota bacterium]